MPELPEVETTVRGLKKTIIGYTITNLWTDWPKYFRLPKTETEFHKHVIGKKITAITRRGKNILIYLQPSQQALGHTKEYILLIHQKLSGHLMVGMWTENKKTEKLVKELEEKWQSQKWIPKETKGPLTDPKNRFIRLIFFLKPPASTKYNIQNTIYKKMLALSDLRRFAKVMCGEKETILNLPDIKNLGPEPLRKKFTFKDFKSIFIKKRGPIKKNLLDQSVISGIGNIYADEILWQAKIHPLSKTEKLSSGMMEKIFRAMKEILPLAIRNGGTSMDDYRHVTGKKGGHEKHLLAYQKTGIPCSRCGTKIQRIKMGLRSSHFCPKCQPLLP